MLNEINNNEEQYVKARLDELPSWVKIEQFSLIKQIDSKQNRIINSKVFFPDIERAEWLNRIIRQAWPFANRFLDKTIFHETIIPMIRTSSSALADFSFQKLDLGETVRNLSSFFF